MRLDKFLKVTCLIKRRSVAQEASKEGFIQLNGKVAKPGTVVKDKDILVMDMWNYYKKIEIIEVPQKNSVPKSDMDNYIKVVEYTPKDV